MWSRKKDCQAIWIEVLLNTYLHLNTGQFSQVKVGGCILPKAMGGLDLKQAFGTW